ncbi:MAG: S1C family serine protease [Pseudomonadota bacterium]
MTRIRSIRWLAALALACLLPAFSHTAAAQAGGDVAPDALVRARSAVVGVLVAATEGARSAETLGERRGGSGVVIGADGLILTIGYLLLEADRVGVVTQDGRTLPARAVAYDLATGFGLVRTLVPLPGIEPVPLGSVAGLETGEPLLVAVGGVRAEVALTRVVSRRPFSGYWEYHIDSALFTSPPNGNHSGAPVFNRRGELLGIGSLFVADALGDGKRMPGNMYLPVDLLKPILAELQASGTTSSSRRAWIGVNAAEQGGRVQVVRITKDSPAQDAGLAPGDVVAAVDGVPVDSLERFYKKLWERPNPDDEVRLTVRRGDAERQVTLRAVDRMSTMKKPAGI